MGRQMRGAALTEAAVKSGCDLVLARVWEDVDSSWEFVLKSWGMSPKLCPICDAEAHKRGESKMEGKQHENDG